MIKAKRVLFPALGIALTMVWRGAMAAPQAQPNAGAPQQANSSAPGGGAPQIVGSVFGENLTWDDFISQFRKDFPQQFKDTVAQVIGPSVADQLFGDSPKTSVTLTPDEVLQQLKQNPPPSLYNAVNAILQLMMVEHEAAAEGVTVTPAEVDQALDQQLKQLRTQGVIPASLTDDQFLAQRHISRDQLRVSERFRLLLEGLMKKDLEKKLGHPIGPGDFVDARHILIKAPDIQPNSSAADKKADADAKAKAEQIRAQILAKKISFEDAAKKYSDDTGTKNRGGDLGVFMRGQMVAPFDAAVFSLKPGQISQPVHTQYGYHVIEVIKTGDQIPADQRQQVLDQVLNQQANEYITQLSQKAGLKNNLQPPAPMGLPPQAGR
jgi:parvulin-like peptidyl-prolyl isomerase